MAATAEKRILINKMVELYIVRSVEEIYKIYTPQDKVPRERYMGLYTLVFNYCSQPPLSIEEPDFVGADLYEKLKEFITGYAEELLQVNR